MKPIDSRVKVLRPPLKVLDIKGEVSVKAISRPSETAEASELRIDVNNSLCEAVSSNNSGETGSLSIVEDVSQDLSPQVQVSED